jgi:hypothetical protein
VPEEITRVAVPAQRTPSHDTMPADPAEPGRPPLRRPPALLIVLVIAVATGLIVPIGDRASTVIAAADTPAAAEPASAPTPFEQAKEALDAQAAALVRGDRQGWLAAVDPDQPALRRRYQELFRSLRALHVTQFEYHPLPGTPDDGVITMDVTLAYCFSRTGCPPYTLQAEGGPARTGQQLTLKPGKAGYVISKLADAPQYGGLAPSPWEGGDLVFAQGKRVTVGAPRSLAKRLPAVLKRADRAAVVADRIAGYMANPQLRYRIFLATDADWTKWYGGGLPAYAVAYTVRLNGSGSDVVLHLSRLEDSRALALTVQHELTHVATLSHLATVSNRDLWLTEGVAEYAAWLPLHAGADLTVPSVRAAFRGANRPRSIVQAPLSKSAKQSRVNLFYGLGNYAVDCLTTTFGEAKAMTFVRLKLRERKTLDTASRQAFGKPFATVDKACLTWIDRRAG